MRRITSHFITLRLFAGLSAVLMLLVAASAVILFYFGEQLSAHHAQRQSKLMVRSIASASATFLMREDITGLEQLLHGYALQNELLFAVVYDNKDRQQAYAVNDLGAWNSYIKDIYSTEAFLLQESMIIAPDEKNNRSSPPLGYVIAGYAPQQFMQISETLILIAITALGSYAIFCISTVAFFVRRWKKRLQHLANTSWRVSHGNLMQPLVDSQEDEIGRIAGSLDMLRKMLIRRETDLRRMQDSLKLQVKERTFEMQMHVDKVEASSEVTNLHLSKVIQHILPSTSRIIELCDRTQDNPASDTTQNTNERISEIRESAQNIRALVQSIQKISELKEVRSGDTASKNDIDLYQLINKTLAALHTLATEKNILLWLHYDLKVPPIIHERIEKLQWALNILLQNSIRFSQEGVLEVRVWSNEIGHGQYLYVIEIHDSGRRLEESEIAKLFSEESKDTDPQYREQMGLLACKQMIEGMQGRLHVESNDGGGTSFSIQLVMEGRQKEHHNELLEQAYALHGYNLLLLSKNEQLAQQFCGSLEEYNLRLGTFPSLKPLAAELKKLIKENLSPILLIDASSIEYDDIIRKLQAFPAAFSELPIIVLNTHEFSAPLHKEFGDKNTSHVTYMGGIIGNVGLLQSIVSAIR